ncbi:MAG: PadR family transcriptional regulator [Propioniciclava sp.]|uniref:PadR family transcriptional regulator n=1 Tax=Propioniciclava sp. TaxID=2038686 RepID=UPI0039E217BA
MKAEERDPQLLKGVLPILVIGLLDQAESYGYELVTRLRESGLHDVSPGTVYPVLGRLEREGHLSSRLEASASGPARKYYRPTPSGQERYRSGLLAWAELRKVVDTITQRREETNS